MNLCLGSLPGCVGLNETNWLVPELGVAVPDFRFSADAYRPACRACVEDCPHLTRNLRESLQRDPTRWLETLGSQFPGQTIVSAEKSVSNLETLYSGNDHDMLVLFRHPLIAWNSVEKRPWKLDKRQRVLRRWKVGNQELVDRPVSGRKVFLELETFTARPVETMRELTEALELPYSGSFLRYWEVEQHYVGGNFGLRERIEQHPDKLQIRHTSRHVGVQAELRLTENRPALMSLYNHMRSQSIGRPGRT